MQAGNAANILLRALFGFEDCRNLTTVPLAWFLLPLPETTGRLQLQPRLGD